jgi:hypothetical protein
MIHKAPFTRTVALQIFVHIRPILPGSPTDFETGILFSLHPIFCNVMSVGQTLTKIRLTAWQNQSDSKNQTDFWLFRVNDP